MIKMLLMETHIGLLYFSNASMVDARSETKTKQKMWNARSIFYGSEG